MRPAAAEVNPSQHRLWPAKDWNIGKIQGCTAREGNQPAAQAPRWLVFQNLASQPISRVLSRTIIHLGCLSPDTSSDLPALSAGHTCRGPIWSCSERGLPCHGLLPAARCALTAPFHPYLCSRRSHRRSTLCCTFRRLAPPRRYLAFHPMEPGLSSTALPEGRAAAIVWLTRREE